MRRVGWLAAALAVAGCAGLAPAPIFDGISYSRMASVAAGVPQAIHVLRIDLTRPGIAIEVSPADSADGARYRAQTTSSFVAGNHLQAAVNGGFFQPFRGGSFGGDDYYPRPGDAVGVTVPTTNGGPTAASICIRKPAIVSVEPGPKCPDGTDESLSAGPLLMKGGRAQELGTDARRHPRTAFGLSADRKIAWMVVVDGRQPFWSAGATLGELAAIFSRLGAARALNLDGGGSTTLVVFDASEPRVVNSPIHTGIPGRERPVANHLGVRARRADLSPPSPGNGPAAR